MQSQAITQATNTSHLNNEDESIQMRLRNLEEYNLDLKEDNATTSSILLKAATLIDQAFNLTKYLTAEEKEAKSNAARELLEEAKTLCVLDLRSTRMLGFLLILSDKPKKYEKARELLDHYLEHAASDKSNIPFEDTTSCYFYRGI